MPSYRVTANVLRIRSGPGTAYASCEPVEELVRPTSNHSQGLCRYLPLGRWLGTCILLSWGNWQSYYWSGRESERRRLDLHLS